MSFAFQNLSEISRDMLSTKSIQLIRILDLTENNFNGKSDLRFLFEFPNLKTLILDKNQIESHIKLPFLGNLQTLWVNHNRIENLAIFLQNIVDSCPNLTYLSMINNKAAPSYFNGGSLNEHQDYRLYVISKVPKLTMLDSKEISAEERAKAKTIYGNLALIRKNSTNANNVKKRLMRSTTTVEHNPSKSTTETTSKSKSVKSSRRPKSSHVESYLSDKNVLTDSTHSQQTTSVKLPVSLPSDSGLDLPDLKETENPNEKETKLAEPPVLIEMTDDDDSNEEDVEDEELLRMLDAEENRSRMKPPPSPTFSMIADFESLPEIEADYAQNEEIKNNS